jgi:uncharacterized protein (TIGR02646 family)
MKKVNKSPRIPPLLDAYRSANLNDDWDQFCGNDQNGKKEIQTTLRADQRGVCAYCENQLAQFHGHGLDDFRVEHFHSKKRPPNPPPNWSLDWTNLLAVCTGGNARYVGNPALCTTPDHSCDVPKGDKNLVDVILDVQIDIPAFPPIFEFDEQGGMSVGQLCPLSLQGKAQSSIDELRLSPMPCKDIPTPRLIRFRRTVIETLREQMGELLGQGLNDAQAASQLAETYFADSQASPWPSFFSCIRWYLGPAAETRLHAINYNG